ncbi:Hypothetical predicted protein [Olea europaea subsp. europaea]|uniref:Uncharacterized protein n=1 Tax=Olea europaea subsp. europaea TaxID=158383 RepID=A0A8S0UQ50_OLEEU|nr:Hypothetical predicted protein [Olea europaea subsp. europaea]
MEYDVMILNLQYSIWFPALIGDMVYGAEQPFFLEREGSRSVSETRQGIISFGRNDHSSAVACGGLLCTPYGVHTE